MRCPETGADRGGDTNGESATDFVIRHGGLINLITDDFVL
jgi:hypothetical protein